MRGGHLSADANLALNEQLREWLQRNVSEQRLAAEYPHINLELEKSELLVQLVLMRFTRLMGLNKGVDTLIRLDEFPAVELMARLQQLRDRASALRCDDVEARARLMIVELLDLADDHPRMCEAADTLVAQCKASGDARIEQEAKAYREGRSTFREAREAMIEPGEGRNVSEMTEPERAHLADQLLDLLYLPPERRANVLEDIACTVREEELRKSWCRHFKIEQFNVPSEEGPRLYARQPLRRCVCLAREVGTELPSRTWRPLVGEFQRNYCNSCNLRET